MHLIKWQSQAIKSFIKTCISTLNFPPNDLPLFLGSIFSLENNILNNLFTDSAKVLTNKSYKESTFFSVKLLAVYSTSFAEWTIIKVGFEAIFGVMKYLLVLCNYLILFKNLVSSPLV